MSDGGGGGEPRALREYILASAAVAVSLLLGVFVIWRPETHAAPSFRKLPLAYKLTQTKAGMLTLRQITGADPLIMTDNDMHHQQYTHEPPTLRDVKLSMAEDAKRFNFTGICAMNFNLPLNMCYMPRLGNETDIYMFNMRITGWSKGWRIANETSMLCDQGRQAYGPQRFDWIWLDYTNEWGGGGLLWRNGTIGRALQHMYWLNRGATVCNIQSIERQGHLLAELAEDFRAV